LALGFCAPDTGSEVLRPMVIPVLNGLLSADEVIDLFTPVLFYRVRLRRLSVTAIATGGTSGASGHLDSEATRTG
jgi:hypothetical protein